MKTSWLRVIVAGLVGGFVGNGVLGALFSSPPVRRVLYDPMIQSALFRFRKGLFWGFVIWSMYWLFQEWFIYHTLLGEPLLLNLLELAILLVGSLIEGVIIAYIVGAGIDGTRWSMLSNREHR